LFYVKGCFLIFGHEFGQGRKPSKLDNEFAKTKSRKKASMNKFTHLSQYLGYLFDDSTIIKKAAEILTGILKAHSARLSDIAREMAGGEARNYKCLQRFLDETQPQEVLLRLFQEDAPFVIGDPTEMPRPQAKKTEYVGTLSDGQTSGYWLLFLATPYRGRAIPCHFVSYSSRTINAEATSRNRYHFQAFAQLKELLGEMPLVLDREFSYLELMQALVTEQLKFVIRLKVGPNFFDQEGQPVLLSVQKGEKRLIPKVFYMGKVFVNVVGWWKEGLSEPMWIMTNLPAEQGLEIYLQRMKIEETFRDLKSLLGLDKMMQKKRSLMEKMVALMMIAYAVSLILGEALRDHLFPETSRKRKQFSGPFILIRLKLNLPKTQFLAISAQALQTFSTLIAPVRTLV
jgi:hypothetical protein